MISLLAAAVIASASPNAVDNTVSNSLANESVLCMENNGNGETMWIAVAEKFRTGRKSVRQIELDYGKKKCLRYDNVRSLVVNHYYMSEALRRVENKDRIDPWRVQACKKVLKNGAAFFRLGSKSDNIMTCEADTGRSDADIRRLVAKANPFRG